MASHQQTSSAGSGGTGGGAGGGGGGGGVGGGSGGGAGGGNTSQSQVKSLIMLDDYCCMWQNPSTFIKLFYHLLIQILHKTKYFLIAVCVLFLSVHLARRRPAAPLRAVL